MRTSGLSLGLAAALPAQSLSQALAPYETSDEAWKLLMDGMKALGDSEHGAALVPTSAVRFQSQATPPVTRSQHHELPELGEDTPSSAAQSQQKALDKAMTPVPVAHSQQQAPGAGPSVITGPPVKVFVMPVPNSFTSELVQCYREARGRWPWDDSAPHGDCDTNSPRSCRHCERGNTCSASLGVEVAQHASDIWLHKGMQAHGWRVMTAADADVIFVPFYGSISYELGECKGIGHHDRVKLLADRILNSPWWAQKSALVDEMSHVMDVPVNSSRSVSLAKSASLAPGRRFVLAVSHWRVAATLASPLRELIGNSQAVVLTQDNYFFDLTRGAPVLDGDDSWKVPGWACRANDQRYTITIPYPPVFINRAMRSTQSKPHIVGPRKKLVFFRGNTALSSCTVRAHAKVGQPEFCHLRSNLVTAAATDCPGDDLDLLSVDKTNEKVFGYDKRFSTALQVEGMRQSTFCLVPRGDTPSSRRVFDAIEAGCIPVLISDDFRPPFSEELDWTNFSVRLTMGHASAKPCELFEKLRSMPSEEVRQRQARLRQVAPMFSYGQWGVGGLTPGGAVNLTLSAVRKAVALQDAGDVSGSVCGDYEHPSKNATILPANITKATRRTAPAEVFMIFSSARSASTTLCDHLTQQPDVTMLYELLNFKKSDDDPFGVKRFRCDIGYCEQTSWEADLPGFMRAVSRYCPTRYCGFKIFDTSLYPWTAVEQLFTWGGQTRKGGEYPKTKMVLLERKDVEAEHRSLSRAWATGEWATTPCLANRTGRSSAQPLGATGGFNTSLKEFKQRQKWWFNKVRTFVSHGPQFELTTEKFIADQTSTTSQVLDFLGVRRDPKASLLANWAVCPAEEHLALR